MTTIPITAVRQALDDTEAALARLRPALGAAYGIAGENLTKAAGQLDVAERARAAAERRAETAERDARIYRDRLTRAMTARVEEKASANAAEQGDASAVHLARSAAAAWQQRAEAADQARAHAKRRAEQAEKALAAMEADRNRHQKYAVKASQRLAAADQRAQLADDRAVKAERAAAHTAQVETGRAMWKSKAEQIERRLAAVEKARAEAERVADRATQTLLRIKHAPTAAAAWTELGTYYHLPATEAGRQARDWRSAAERDAAARAEQAEVSRRRWKRRAKTAEQALDDIRTPGPVGRDHPMYALIAAMTGPGIDQAEARERVTDYFDAITGREQ
ncbi:hypothetical protein [Streptomyces sp. TRM75563]|uniref:hypothetical protein n=1 Tax=Streptomyces sp. TRM75563 TaxID=2817418 RepID=UPI001F61DACA|nr:hypothetical protein [Streptomyces sp. TRM75563]MCI4045459.1 hypothetical protein [Streptomyces sp. TRM75563]